MEDLTQISPLFVLIGKTVGRVAARRIKQRTKDDRGGTGERGGVKGRNMLTHLGLRISPDCSIVIEGHRASPGLTGSSVSQDRITGGASQLVHTQGRTRTQPRCLHRPGEPGDRVPEPAEDQVRYPEGPGAAGREGEADRQEGVRRLEPVSALHGAVPRGGHRADRDPQAVARPGRTRPISAWWSTRSTWPGASPTSTPS